MKKDIKWLKAEVEKQDIIMDKGHIYTDDLLYLIDQLDEPEVLTQDWISEHMYYVDDRDSSMIYVSDLQNLLVPKQELPVVIPKYVADWIEEMKQDERPLYSAMSSLMNKTNREWANWKRTNKNFSEIVAQAWLDGYEVEEEPLYHALVKGHELMTDADALESIFWNFDTFDGDLYLSNRYSKQERFLTKMTMDEWNELGINDLNADFIKVGEVAE